MTLPLITASPSPVRSGASRRWSFLAWVVVTALVAARVPQQRAAALALARTSPSPDVESLDPSLLILAANVGVTLAVVFSSVLFLVYQGIGMSVEKRLASPANTRAPGPFWWTSLLCVGGTHGVSLILGLLTVRGSWAWYVTVAATGLAIALVTLGSRRRRLADRASLVLIAALVGFALLSTLF